MEWKLQDNPRVAWGTRFRVLGFEAAGLLGPGTGAGSKTTVGWGSMFDEALNWGMIRIEDGEW